MILSVRSRIGGTAAIQQPTGASRVREAGAGFDSLPTGS